MGDVFTIAIYFFQISLRVPKIGKSWAYLGPFGISREYFGHIFSISNPRHILIVVKIVVIASPNTYIVSFFIRS